MPRFMLKAYDRAQSFFALMHMFELRNQNVSSAQLNDHTKFSTLDVNSEISLKIPMGEITRSN